MEKKKKNINDIKTEYLTLKEIGISLLYICFITILTLHLITIKFMHAITIWLFLSCLTILIPLLIYYFTIQKNIIPKWGLIKRIAEFGKKIWLLENIWYVVFLVGVFASVIDTVNKIEGDDITRSILSYLFEPYNSLYLTKDLIVALFIALIAAVLAKTFGKFESLSGKIEEARTEIDNEVKDTVDKSKTKIDEATSNLKSGLETVIRVQKHEIRLLNIEFSSESLQSTNNNYEPFNTTIKNLQNTVSRFDNEVLNPLIIKSEIIEDKDPIIELSEKIRNYKDEYMDCVSHAAYMAATIDSYFDSELEERRFPGVQLNITSFSYYVTTVKKIIESLEPWWNDYEFYTLMPKSPLSVFRFSNSIDIKLWTEFLGFFYDFQKKNITKWIRYFLYEGNPIKYSGIKNKKTKIFYKKYIQDNFKHGFFIKDKDSNFLPKLLTEEEIKANTNHIINSEERGKAEDENEIHGEKGTLAVLVEKRFSNGNNFIKFDDCFFEFHQNDKNNSLLFREFDDNLNGNNEEEKSIFKMSFEIQMKEIKKKKNDINKEITRTRNFSLPKDIFAILKKPENGKNYTINDWKFIIGLDEELIENKATDNKLAFSPVIDLDKLCNNTIKENRDLSASIRMCLDKLFKPKGNKGLKNYNEFMND